MAALASSDLLKTEGLSHTTTNILSFIRVLDDYGAQTWNLRAVALMSTVLLVSIRKAFGKQYGIDWYAAVHAVVSSFGAMACVYLNLMDSETLTGSTEPLRTLNCEGPLTSLHRILPAITAGYSLLDLYDGLEIGSDFAMHGAATFVVMTFFCEAGVPHL
jgi:hypothetical protein